MCLNEIVWGKCYLQNSHKQIKTDNFAVKERLSLQKFTGFNKGGPNICERQLYIIKLDVFVETKTLKNYYNAMIYGK